MSSTVFHLGFAIAAIISITAAQSAGEEIEVEMCRNAGYNMTKFPNKLGHSTQAEAAAALQEMGAMLQQACPGPNIARFMCISYVPPAPVPSPWGFEVDVGPCRSLCEAATGGCPALSTSSPDCSIFPADGATDMVCVPAVGAGEGPQTDTATRESGAPGTGGAGEAIEIELCRNPVYSETKFPNLLGHETQAQAAQAMESILGMVRQACPEVSPAMKIMMCLIYIPPVTRASNNGGYPVPRTSCRSLCEAAKASCPVMLGTMWDCDVMPADGENSCISAANLLEAGSEATAEPETPTAEPETGVTGGRGANTMGEALEAEVCRNPVYSKTQFPNLLGHTTQTEAAEALQGMMATVGQVCPSTNPALTLILCLTYIPPVPTYIGGYPVPRSACRSLCEAAKASCPAIMANMQDCDIMPADGENNCISAHEITDVVSTPEPAVSEKPETEIGGHREVNIEFCGGQTIDPVLKDFQNPSWVYVQPESAGCLRCVTDDHATVVSFSRGSEGSYVTDPGNRSALNWTEDLEALKFEENRPDYRCNACFGENCIVSSSVKLRPSDDKPDDHGLIMEGVWKNDKVLVRCQGRGRDVYSVKIKPHTGIRRAGRRAMRNPIFSHKRRRNNPAVALAPQVVVAVPTSAIRSGTPATFRCVARGRKRKMIRGDIFVTVREDGSL